MAVIYNFQPARQYITAKEWRSRFHPDDVARLVSEAALVHQPATLSIEMSDPDCGQFKGGTIK